MFDAITPPPVPVDDELILAYSTSILKGSWYAAKDTAVFAFDAATDSDVLLKPLASVVYDAALICTSYIDLDTDSEVANFALHESNQGNNELTSRFQFMKQVKSKEQQVHEAEQRMMVRINNLVYGADDLYKRLKEADGPRRAEMLAYGVSSILVPGTVVKGVGAVTKMVSTLDRWGTLQTPRLFHNTKLDKLSAPQLSVATLSKAEIRNLQGTRQLLYVVLENGEIVLSENSITSSILTAKGSHYIQHITHAQLSKLTPVRAAGHVTVSNGFITSIDNFSGHFLPFGESLRPVVEKSFVAAGFSDAAGRFKLYNFKVKNPLLSPIVTQEGLGLGFGKDTLLMGTTVSFSQHLSDPIKDKLKNASPDSYLKDFDEPTRHWMATEGTPADKVWLKNINTIETYEQSAWFKNSGFQ